MQSKAIRPAIEKARDARLERGGDTDYELYELISEHSGLGAYELSKLNGWTAGHTHSSILRLEKKGLVFVEAYCARREDKACSSPQALAGVLHSRRA
jgi:hypothetical protein